MDIPVFPLPNVVFFPKTLLPLHIFKERYRAMVKDALEGERMIAMALLQPGWEEQADGAPAVYPVACVGRIELVEELKDGCYNIVLLGLHRVRIVEFSQDAPYRRAIVKILDDPDSPVPELHPLHDEILALTRQLVARNALHDEQLEHMLEESDFERLVNSLASRLPFGEEHKQQLLEINAPIERAAEVVEFLRGFADHVEFLRKLNYRSPDNPEDN